MNRNLLLNIVLAISAALFAFLLMLFLYLGSSSTDAIIVKDTHTKEIELEYSFTNISEISAVFNTTDLIAENAGYLKCNETIVLAVENPVTTISGLVAGETYECTLEIAEQRYSLIAFQTLQDTPIEKYGFTAYQSSDENSGRVIRLRWELDEEIILTRSSLDAGGAVLAQEEFLLKRDGYTDRIPADTAEYELQYELRRVSSPTNFSAIRLSADVSGLVEISLDLPSTRIASEDLAISENVVELENLNEYYLFEKIRGVLILTNQFSDNLNSHYALSKSEDTILYPAISSSSRVYALAKAELYGKTLFVSGAAVNGANIAVIYENGKKDSLKALNGKIELEDVYASLLVYNGIDRYLKVYQRAPNFKYVWSQSTDTLSWDAIPGALFYTVEVYDFNNNLIDRFLSSSSSMEIRNSGYEEELKVKVYYTSMSNKVLLGDTVVKLDPNKSQIQDFSIAKLDNGMSASWKAKPDDSYLLEISKEGSSVWNLLKETSIGQSQIVIQNVSRLNPGSYQLRLSVIDKAKPPVYTISNCNLEVSVDKTFRIVCK
jgi:hypothetical protein